MTARGPSSPSAGHTSSLILLRGLPLIVAHDEVMGFRRGSAAHPFDLHDDHLFRVGILDEALNGDTSVARSGDTDRPGKTPEHTQIHIIIISVRATIIAGASLQVIDLQGWKYRLDSSAFKSAQNAISALAAEDLLIPVARLNRYATAADAIGRIDLEEAAGSSTQHTRSVILSSVLRRPLLDALILLAQEHYAQSL